MKLSNAGKRRSTGPVQPSMAGRKEMRHSRPSTLNISLIIISIVAGGAAWCVGIVLDKLLADSIHRILVMGAVFAILCLFTVLGAFFVSHASDAFEGNIFNGTDGWGSVLAIMLIGITGIFIAAAFFQWIYSIDLKKESAGATAYVFVIDDSGSTSQTDPDQLRYSAIADVLDGMDEDFPYMIYGFSDGTTILRDMAPISSGMDEITGMSSGGTSIRGTLSKVIEDYENQVWNAGAHPKVILLTDGYATDIDWSNSISSVLKRYVKANISISTVGLAEADKNLMEQIADTTGGVFINVEDVSELSEAMQSAAVRTAARDLISVRCMAGNVNILYGIIRVLFLALLGIGIGFLAAVAYGQQESFPVIMISSVVKSLIGAFIMEIGTSLAGMSDKWAWFILWLMIALTIASRPGRARRPNKNSRDVRRPSGRSGH